ncbi:MAG TPA: KGG domain-containing protein [Pseudobdellovibrionaceae bacterium]|jgi:hypothetical protein
MATKQGNTSDNKGFASMDPQKQKESAKKGGEASHGGGRDSSSSKSDKSEAGRKGGSQSGK